MYRREGCVAGGRRYQGISNGYGRARGGEWSNSLLAISALKMLKDSKFSDKQFLFGVIFGAKNVTIQGVCSNVRRIQEQKIPRKSWFFAMRPSWICSGVPKFHKKYSLPSSQSLIFRGLARGYTPLNAYHCLTRVLGSLPGGHSLIDDTTPLEAAKHGLKPVFGCILANSCPDGSKRTVRAEVYQCHALRFSRWPFAFGPVGHKQLLQRHFTTCVS